MLRGQICGGLPNDPDDLIVDLMSDHYSSGLSLVADSWYSLCLAFPLGLPRWKRLTRGYNSGRRWPQGAGGILVLAADTTPAASGLRSCILPTAFGVGGGVLAPAVAIGIFRTDGSAAFMGAECTWDGWHSFQTLASGAGLPSGSGIVVQQTASAVATAADAVSHLFTLNRGGTLALPYANITGFRATYDAPLTTTVTVPLAPESLIYDAYDNARPLVIGTMHPVMGQTSIGSHIKGSFEAKFASNVNSGVPGFRAANIPVIIKVVTSYLNSNTPSGTASVCILRIWQLKMCWGAQ
jgi:hypothetical protein